MADNTELFLGSGGDQIRTDELTPGLKVQLVKLMLGALGNEDDPVSTTRPMPTRQPTGVSNVSRTAVTDAGQTVAPAQTNRGAVFLKNVGPDPVEIACGSAPTYGAAFPLLAGEAIILPTTLDVQAICDTGGNASVAKLDLYN